MKGWLDDAKISCSARALFILLRLIISFLDKTVEDEIINFQKWRCE
jgi:hypothetical protein